MGKKNTFFLKKNTRIYAMLRPLFLYCLQVVGTGRSVCLSDRSNLVYVQATLLELQRVS